MSISNNDSWGSHKPTKKVCDENDACRVKDFLMEGRTLMQPIIIIMKIILY